MTTLEIVLMCIVIYLVIGIVVNYLRPQDYYLVEDLDYERFITTIVIILWPIELLRILADNFEDNLWNGK